MKEIKAHAARVHAARGRAITGRDLHGGSHHGGYAKGGAAHSDIAEDKALVRQMVKPDALAHHAKGGRARKGNTVNVVVAPHRPSIAVPSSPIPPIPGGAGINPGAMPSLPAGPRPMPPMKKGGRAK